MRDRKTIVMALVIPLSLWPWIAEAASDQQDRRTRVERMSPAEKQQLAAKLDRFNRLSPADQKRFRKLHSDIDADPQADQLRLVMSQYYKWLKTLSAGDRAELAELPSEQRIERIRQLRETQRKQQFRRLVNRKLKPADVQGIFAWLDEYIVRHEEEIVKILPKEFGRRFRNIDDPKIRRRTVMFAIQRHRLALPRFSQDEIGGLAARLSPDARADLLRAGSFDKKSQLVLKWVRAAIMSQHGQKRMFHATHQVTREQIQRHYNQLPPHQKERLNSLSPERFDEELREMLQPKRKSINGVRPFMARPATGRAVDVKRREPKVDR